MEDLMELSYQKKGDNTYAKVPGKSYRKDGKVCKTGVIYLGRVIDKEHNVFYTRERGIYTYDPKTSQYGKADETFISEPAKDGRRKLRVMLDFGDAFFVDALLRQMHYDEVLASVSYRNKDTLFAMVQYYVLCNTANDHARIWYDGSFAKMLYPKANLTSQRITDFLTSLGDPAKLDAFFDAHVEWIRKYISDDPAILVDSTGLPNDIHFPLAAISNHNGEISRETRMTTLVQRDSGYPLLFRVNPGNIVDMSTITRTMNELYIRGMSADFAIMDAGFYTNDNVEALYEANIDFLTRLPAKYSLYQNLVQNHASDLKRPENLVQYKNRYVYIKRVDVRIGHKRHEAYAYIGYDIERGTDENYKALKRARRKNSSPDQVHASLQGTGMFVIISTLAFESDGILPAYYTRQLVEQYFDISKGSSNLMPLRVHSAETLRGHLMLSMIAATVNVYIQNKTNRIYDSRDELFMTLRNQKCSLHQSKITTSEPQREANEFYKTFDIMCPLYYDRAGEKMTPKYELPRINKAD